jgi:ankyrin repeat protein
MAAKNIQNLPQELLIMIIERLNLKESSAFCEAINISVEWAYQYFNFVRDKNQFKTGRLKMKLAQALVKNTKFQLFARQKDFLAVAILTQDVEVVKRTLNDPIANHDKIDALKLACRYGHLATVKLLVDEYGIDISTHDNVALYEASVNGQIQVLKYILAHPDCD